MIKSVLGRASPLTKRYFLSRLGLDGYLKQAKGVLAHFREPGPANYNPHTNEMSETELMDEDAHELQTHVVNNPYDLEIFGGDITTARNFGTVDNPVLVFSANVGWRYVQCHGMHDEEEGHSHSQVWFVLREGPIHRCHACGQCFKLINLPDAITPESDYYQEHFMPINEDDFGDDEDWMQRWSFHNYTKPYPTLYPHQNTFRAYMLVNNDEHDRILTDPAYRMQKLHQGHQIADAQHRAMMDIEDRWRLENLGKFPKSQYTRQDYEDLATSELAIRRLDRIFSKIQLFNKRQFLDFENHDRREKRMQERAQSRENQIELIPEIDEAEQRFRDYYETDYDSECEQQNDLNDFEEIQQSQLLNFDSFRFVEEGSVFPKEGVVSIFDKKSFRFKHRIWNDPTHVYLARQKRMISRFLQRKANAPKFDLNQIGQAVQKQGFQKAIEQAMPYRNWLVEEAIQQYKDYYESDTEDLEDFKYMSLEERLSFARNFVDYSVTAQKQNKNLTMVGDYSQSLFGGFWSNLKHLLPQAKKVAQEKVQEEFKQGDLTYEKFIEDLKNFELEKTSEPEKIE